MLRVKYFEEFKNSYPFVVVVCDREGLKAAYDFFGQRQSALLCDEAVVEYCDIAPLQETALAMNAKECHAIAEHFINLYKANRSGHAYFDIEALGDIEVIISYDEYDDLF